VLEKGQIVKLTYNGGVVDSYETYPCAMYRFLHQHLLPPCHMY
jgi:hypothetical protein